MPDPETSTRPELVASVRHTIVFTAIVAAVMIAGFASQHRHVAGGGLVESHTNVIPVYISITSMNGLLAYFVWKGIRKRGISVASLIGGRWGSVRDILRDFGIAALFWGVFIAVAWCVHRLLGQGEAKSIDVLLPRTAAEIAVWVVTSVAAGFCEELVFRGYLQRQLLALSGSRWAALSGQGLFFGVMHAYQGWRAVVSIGVLGVLFGALALWRNTLRVGMVAHAWQDIWAGWLSRLVMS
jgi:membrane protease YdiL (CAAX protease family)